jgi:hypothetical protein
VGSFVPARGGEEKEADQSAEDPLAGSSPDLAEFVIGEDTLR